jgi:predicted double-glycine peptidase
MKPSRPALLAALLGLSCYAGSARDVSSQRAAALASDPAWTFARDVPFVRQQSDSDCGPAALTMVLGHFGVHASVAELVAMSPPGRAGVRAGALRDIARSKGLSAFAVPGTFDDLSAELGAGRPVLVGLAKPITTGRAVPHYEVVVAIDRRDREILTLDPGRGLRENSLAGFAREWAPTGHVAIVVFPPRNGRPTIGELRPWDDSFQGQLADAFQKLAAVPAPLETALADPANQDAINAVITAIQTAHDTDTNQVQPLVSQADTD